MPSEKFVQAEVKRGYILSEPDIARVGILDDRYICGDNACCYRWLTESDAVNYILEKTKFTKRFNLKTNGDTVVLKHIEDELIEFGLLNDMSFNLESMQNIAKMIYLVYSIPDEEEKAKIEKKLADTAKPPYTIQK
jgi:hypothetical protein